MQIKKNEILFSVVIPLYNKEDYILDTLNSVLNQEYQNFEVIIVNDGSTDKSLKVVESLVDPRINIFSILNSGVSVARNLGITKSKGSFVSLLDGDDYWYSNHLSNFITAINKFPNEVVFCNNYEIQLSENIKRTPKYSYLPNKKKYVTINDYFKSSLINSIAWTSAVCISKSIFKNNNYWFDKNMTSGQDTDLWIRLGLGFSFIFNKEITATHNKNISNSLSRSNNYKSRFLITQKYLKEERSNTSLKKFMDSNRFSVLLKCKYKRDTEKVSILRSQIDTSNLNTKQRIIMNVPIGILKKLQGCKNLLAKNGWFDFSVFN